MEQVFNIRELFDEIFKYIEPIDYHINSLVCKQWNQYILKYIPPITSDGEYLDACEKGNYMAIVRTPIIYGHMWEVLDIIKRNGYIELFLHLVNKYDDINYEDLAYCLIKLYANTYPNHLNTIKRYDKMVYRNLFSYNKIKYKHFGKISSMTNFYSKIEQSMNELYLGEFLINDQDELNSSDYDKLKIYHNQCMCIGCVIWDDKMFQHLISSKRPFTPDTILLNNINSIKVNARSTPINDCSDTCVRCQELHTNIDFTVDTNGTLRYMDFQTIRNKLKTYTVKSDDPEKEISYAFVLCSGTELNMSFKDNILNIKFWTFPEYDSRFH